MLKKFFSFIKFRFSHFLSRFFVRKIKLDPSQEFVLLVEEARKEWHRTDNFIQEFKDKNLIDQAIYWQSAAERRYVHLLKQAAREGIKADLGIIVSLALTAHNNIKWGVGSCRQKPGKLF